MDRLNPIDIESSKRDMAKDTTHKEHLAKRSKSMQPPDDKMIVCGS